MYFYQYSTFYAEIKGVFENSGKKEAADGRKNGKRRFSCKIFVSRRQSSAAFPRKRADRIPYTKRFLAVYRFFTLFSKVFSKKVLHFYSVCGNIYSSSSKGGTAAANCEEPTMDKSKIKKVVLAYSGGLDTSVIIPWLKENYNGCEIVCVSGNVGQADELEGLEKKALQTGASKIYIEDLTNDFLVNCAFPCVQAGALYEGYPLGTAFARPFIAKRIAEIAEAEKADAICHGCTGKGNDQVRFELAIKAFAPGIPIIAPWREWDIKSREEEIDYAEAHNVPLKISRETNYSKDKNVWHLSHEGLDLEDPSTEPPYKKPGFLEMSVCPEEAPDTPTYVTVHFEKGVPTAVNGEEYDAKGIVSILNKLGGANGIGLLDLVENRLVGMKSRGLYETPGGTILYHAHKVLETICLDKDTQHYKALVAQKLAEQVYNAQWYSPLTEAILAFVKQTQEFVTGDVKLKLYKGNVINAGVTSPYSLYDPELATFNEDDVYDQADASGFINLYGLPLRVVANMKKKNGVK